MGGAMTNETTSGTNSGNDQRPLILVVDDQPENLATLSAMVREDGADVRVANAGPVALRYARLAPQPDLILLDIMMPGMDGRAVLAELHKDPHTAQIPVIFVTALGAAEDEERGLEEGAVDYITKPIKPAVLRARVRAQLELKRSRDLQRNQQRWLEAEVQRRVSENAQLEAKLQLTLASAGFGVWEIDHAIARCDWNEALCKIFGRESGPGKVGIFLDMVHPEDRRRVENCLTNLQVDAGIIHCLEAQLADVEQALADEGRALRGAGAIEAPQAHRALVHTAFADQPHDRVELLLGGESFLGGDAQIAPVAAGLQVVSHVVLL